MTTTSSARVLKAADVARLPELTVDLRPPDEPDEKVDAATDAGDVATVEADELERRCAEAHARGIEDASEQMVVPLQSIADGLREIAERRPEAMAASFSADAQTIVDAAMAVTEWILGRELADPEHVLDLAKRAIAQNGGPSVTRIHVHPDLVEPLRAVGGEMAVFVPDDNLEPGDFECRTDGPTIAFAMRDAIDRAATTLADGDPTPEAPDGTH